MTPSISARWTLALMLSGIGCLTAGHPARAASEGVQDIPVASRDDDDPVPLRVSWDKGPRFSSEDGKIRLRLGGRLMIDASRFYEDDEVVRALTAGDEEGEPDPFEDGAEIRYARLAVSGVIYGNTEFKLQYDFAGGDAEPKDVYLGVRNLPVLGTVRVGHQREPLSRLEQSTKYITFIERGVGRTLSEGRNTGIRLLNRGLDDRLFWSAGAYMDTDSTGATPDDAGHSFTCRVAGLPWCDEDSTRLVHLATSYSYREPTAGEVRYRARLESHRAPYLVSLDPIPADTVQLVGLEGAAAVGPFSVLSEVLTASVDADDGSDPAFTGYYVTLSYILTGERRTYDRKTGGFRGVDPRRNFMAADGGGPGAWQVAARISGLDLDDGADEQGRVDSVTLGLNWYLNPNSRVMLNYVHSDLKDVGTTEALLTRVQVNF